MRINFSPILVRLYTSMREAIKKEIEKLEYKLSNTHEDESNDIEEAEIAIQDWRTHKIFIREYYNDVRNGLKDEISALKDTIS